MRTGTSPAGHGLAGRLTLGLTTALMALAVSSPPSVADPTDQTNPTGETGQAEQSTDCVGIVVDSGAGTTATGCVPFQEDMTGQEVLRAAGHELTFDQNGFICQIDGHPDQCASDNTHFWSYFHRPPDAADGEWAFSDTGAADYVVHPGETEGWAYQDGTSRQPEAVPYPSLREAAADPAGSDSAATDSATDSATDQAGEDGQDSGGSGTPWPVLLVVALIVVIGGLATRMALARKKV